MAGKAAIHSGFPAPNFLWQVLDALVLLPWRLTTAPRGVRESVWRRRQGE